MTAAMTFEQLDAILSKGPTPGAPLEAPPHPCARCQQLQRTTPDLPIAEAESWYGPNGHRYYAATCSACTDVEYSLRWDRRYEKASETGRAALEREVDAWTKRGRRYVGSRRPGSPAPRKDAPHAEGCRCADCRVREFEQAKRAHAETSLFPEGYDP